MKYLKLFESFEDLHEICKNYRITNYTINEDGSIDIEGDVNLCGRKLTKLPLKFGRVSGGFYCYYNKLATLEGCPTQVGGGFDCSYNNLTTLEGCPTHVSGGFSCSNNKLSTLEGCPTHVGRHFYCDNNQLITLEGCPTHVGGGFYCSNNPVCVIWNLFNDYSKVELFNDYDIIRGNSIVIDRLNNFLADIGKTPVKNVKGYKNI